MFLHQSPSPKIGRLQNMTKGVRFVEWNPLWTAIAEKFDRWSGDRDKPPNFTNFPLWDSTLGRDLPNKHQSCESILSQSTRSNIQRFQTSYRNTHPNQESSTARLPKSAAEQTLKNPVGFARWKQEFITEQNKPRSRKKKVQNTSLPSRKKTQKKSQIKSTASFGSHSYNPGEYDLQIRKQQIVARNRVRNLEDYFQPGV
jgi:hypothetical protein